MLHHREPAELGDGRGELTGGERAGPQKVEQLAAPRAGQRSPQVGLAVPRRRRRGRHVIELSHESPGGQCRRLMSNVAMPVRRTSVSARQNGQDWRGCGDERRTGTGRHAQGRVHPDGGWPARRLDGRRAALRRLGDLPRQRVAGRSGPAVRLGRRAAGSGRSCTAPTTAARPGTRSATTSPTQGEVGEHLWYDGTPRPWEFKRIWHLEPSRDDPDTVYAGAEDAALYVSRDGGQKWKELTALRQHPTGADLAARRRRHVPAHDHPRPGAQGPHLRGDLGRRRVPQRRRRRELAADQQGPALRRDPGHRRRGRPLRAPHHPAPVPPGHPVHAEALGRHAQRRRRRATGARSAASCRRTSASRSRCTPTSRTPIYVVPITSDSEHFPPEGKLRVYRSRTGGDDWEPLTTGLPQADCYVNVYRDAMAVDTLDDVRHLLRHHRRPGLLLGRRRRHVGADRARPAGGALGRSPGAAVIRVVLPAHLKTPGQGRPARCSSTSPARPPHGPVLDALEARYPMLLGTIRDRHTGQRRPFVRFYACEEDLSNDPPDTPLPDEVVAGERAVHHPRARWPAAEPSSSAAARERPATAADPPTPPRPGQCAPRRRSRCRRG